MIKWLKTLSKRYELFILIERSKKAIKEAKATRHEVTRLIMSAKAINMKQEIIDLLDMDENIDSLQRGLDRLQRYKKELF